MSIKKVLLFGSDLFSLRVLQRLPRSDLVPYKINIVLPPSRKPRTPLAELHSWIKG